MIYYCINLTMFNQTIVTMLISVLIYLTFHKMFYKITIKFIYFNEILVKKYMTNSNLSRANIR